MLHRRLRRLRGSRLRHHYLLLWLKQCLRHHQNRRSRAGPLRLEMLRQMRQAVPLWTVRRCFQRHTQEWRFYCRQRHHHCPPKWMQRQSVRQRPLIARPQRRRAWFGLLGSTWLLNWPAHRLPLRVRQCL